MRDIVIECNPDEALLQVLGYTRKMITHQSSKGEVINYLKRNPSAIGIVDDDPGSAKPSYFSAFSPETKVRFGIESYVIDKLKTRLIVMKPRLEEWVLQNALELNVNLSDYSIPATGHELHKVINTRIPKFKDLLSEMVEKGSPALNHLKLLIDHKLS
jgi:hypothetical protein